MDKVQVWLKETSFHDYELVPLFGDASFRSYYRLKKRGEKTLICMDSSLELASLTPFVDVTQRLLQVGVSAPQILAQNRAKGYLILEDFGDTLLLDELNNTNFHTYYTQAIDTIIKMQDASTAELPLYDAEFLLFEMELMQEWYLQKKLSLKLTVIEEEMLRTTLQNITHTVLSQPQDIFVHRDFHARNIMLKEDGTLGIIDYQDAMSGAVTYDLVSLLKDCYIAFEREEILQLVLYFKKRKNIDVADALFIKWFDFMGMQRHIKVLGVFSRLHIRDKKDGYLKDIPLVLEYLIQTAARYEETQALCSFLQNLKATE